MNDRQFAKLFERNGEQVLVTKESDEETSVPILQLRFLSTRSGHCIKIALSFKEDLSDLPEDLLDKAFDAITEDQAFGIRDKSPAVDW